MLVAPVTDGVGVSVPPLLEDVAGETCVGLPAPDAHLSNGGPVHQTCHQALVLQGAVARAPRPRQLHPSSSSSSSTLGLRTLVFCCCSTCPMLAMVR